jgi:hypothetical protein
MDNSELLVRTLCGNESVAKARDGIAVKRPTAKK